jgi:hypothetical protein
MRFRGMEGSPEEIKNLCLNLGFNKDELLDAKEEVSLLWLSIPVLLFIVCSTLLRFNVFVECKDVLVIIELMLILWIAAAVQIRHKSFWVTGLCLTILSLVLGYCLNFLNVMQIVSKLVGFK